MVRAAGGWLLEFWGMWCRTMMEARCIGCAVVMVVGDRGCGNFAGVAGECYSLAEVAGWVGVEVLLPPIRQRFLPLLLLVEDVNILLHLCQPHALPIDLLSLSFGSLSDVLSSHDGFLLLSKPLHILLDPDQLALIGLSFLFFCFIPILDFDLVELGFALVDLQRW
jgi:hypothetical protein